MKDKISSRQMILLLTIYRLTTSISYMPVKNLPPANQDIWIMMILSLFYSIIFKIPLLFLANKFSGLTLTEYIEKVLGKFVGKFLNILFGIYFILHSIFLVLVQVELIGADILPFSSNWLIIGIFIIIALYIGSKDLMTIIWVGELITPINLISIVFLIFAGINRINYRVLLPILSDSKLLGINLGAMMTPFILTDIFILAMNIPYLENKKDINKIFLKSAIYSTIISVIAVIVTQTSLGIQQTKHSNYPFLIYTRLINFRSILERIDPIYVITWISANTMKIVTIIYISSIVFKEILGMKTNKVIFYIITILVGLVSLYISVRDVIVPLSKPLNRFVIYTSAIFITIIPTIVLIVYLFRRKTLDREEKLQS